MHIHIRIQELAPYVQMLHYISPCIGQGCQEQGPANDWWQLGRLGFLSQYHSSYLHLDVCYYM